MTEAMDFLDRDFQVRYIKALVKENAKQQPLFLLELHTNHLINNSIGAWRAISNGWCQ